MSPKGLVAILERWAFDGLHKGWTVFDYATSAGDIPRITATHELADSWADLNGLPYEAVTQFGVASDGSRRMVAPDGTVTREYYGTGYQRGLVTTAKVFANATDEAINLAQKTTTLTWDQDNTTLAYEKNPRIKETNVSDAAGNNRRATFDYTTFTRPSGALCSLPTDTNEFNGLSLYRRTHRGGNNWIAVISRAVSPD
ncbi:MAG: hypothetical protein ND895_13980 [Pyrinomonadaceae bacterium]|nr:hypothetical protein [Pyrinomonadaceae bacterium]